MDMKLLLSVAIFVMSVTIFQCDACPGECACSETQVDCHRRRLQAIPEGIPELVMTVDLSDNDIADVDNDKLSTVANLRILMLQSNSIKELKPPAFANLTLLTKLHIGNNKIENISESVFINLPSLRDLDLTNNTISEITGKFNLPNLKRLTLSLNQITTLEDSTLDGIRNLTHLVLSDNKITFISRSALNGMSQLSYLILRGNPLKSIDNIFHDVGTMSYLDASSCQLSWIPKNLPWALRHLKMSDNQVTMLDSQDLRSTRYLGILDLYKNQIRVIHESAFLYTPYLKQINIANNKVKNLPEIPKNVEIFLADNNEIQQIFQSNFAHDSAMKALSLGNNTINNIGAYTFSRLVNLTTLHLNRNNITNIRNMTFSGLRQVLSLTLDFNPIEKIEYRAFAGLQKLAELNLSNADSSQTIAEGIIFQDTPALISLDLQGSPSIIKNIQQSPELLRSLRSLQRLNLRNGNLETLPVEIRASLPNLNFLQLSDNLWHCDTELVELRKWIVDSPQLFADSTITCATPDHLKGRPLKSVSVEELTKAATPVSSSEMVLRASTATSYPDEDLNETTADGQFASAIDIYELLSTKETISIMPAATLFPEDGNSLSLSFLTASITEQQIHISATSLRHDTLQASGSEPTTSPAPRITKALRLSSSAITLSTSSYPKETSTTSQPLASTAASIKHSQGSDSQSSTASKDVIQVLYTSRQSSSPALATAAPTTINIQPKPDITPQATSTDIKASVMSSSGHTKSPDITSPSPSYNLYPASTTITTADYPRIYPSSTLAASMTTLHTQKLTYQPNRTAQETNKEAKLATNIEAKLATNIEAKLATNIEAKLETSDIPTTTAVLLSVSSLSFLESGSVSLEATAMVESSTVQDFVHKTLEKENTSIIGVDFSENRNNYPIKPSVKTENRLPTFNAAADARLRAIIIVVAVSLLALAVGLLVVVFLVRYHRKRKRVSFSASLKNDVVFQNETSDTAFILSHMDGEQTGHSNTDLKNGMQSNTGPMSNKQTITPSSSFISRTNFGCIRGRNEDDSDLLMDSWK